MTDLPVHVPLVHLREAPSLYTLAIVRVHLHKTIMGDGNKFGLASTLELHDKVVLSVFGQRFPRPNVLQLCLCAAQIFHIRMGVAYPLLEL